MYALEEVEQIHALYRIFNQMESLDLIGITIPETSKKRMTEIAYVLNNLEKDILDEFDAIGIKMNPNLNVIISPYVGNHLDDPVYLDSMELYSIFIREIEKADVIIEKTDSGKIELVPNSEDTKIKNYSKIKVYQSVLNELNNRDIWIYGTKEHPIIIDNSGLPIIVPLNNETDTNGGNYPHYIERSVFNEIIRALAPKERKYIKSQTNPKKKIQEIYTELMNIKDTIDTLPTIIELIPPTNKDYTHVEPINEFGTY